jgi:predicted RND superfamily exporter protein
VIDLEADIRQIGDGKLSKVISLADAEQAARQSTLLATLPMEVRLTGMRTAMPSFFDSLITPGKEKANRTLRIMLRSSERMSVTEKLDLIAMVENRCRVTAESLEWRKHFLNQEHALLPPPVVTGYYVLLSNLVQSVVADQWICFLIATLAILLALRVAIGSWKLSLVALVPNTLPALGAIAALGILGIKMNLGAAMIAAVSIGLSVDSSLHYLIEYQRARNSGLHSRAALEQSQRSVGMPVIVSTIALVLGFASLAISDFIPTVVFGVMASITMAVGLVGNLWWLPVLINLVDRSDQPCSRHQIVG